MKVAVINFSGNVGKTTVSGQLLQPRMGNPKVFSVESINAGSDSDGITVEKLRGKMFGGLIDELILLDSAIVDVGASNVEDFLKMMQQFSGSHEEFDVFIVPTVRELKVQEDTINTILTLADIGVPREKIKLVFNKVELDWSIKSEFINLFGLEGMNKNFILDTNASISANEVYERLKSVGKSLYTITNDTVDYREKLRNSTTDSEKKNCLQMIALKRLSITANKNLDDVYNALFP